MRAVDKFVYRPRTVRRAVNIYLLLPALAIPFALLALVSPETFLKVGALAIASAIMALICIFPATFLGIVILLSIFAYARFGVMDLDTQTPHRVLVLLALAINMWRYGIVGRSNPPVLALLVMFLITLVAADPLPSLTKFGMIKSLVGLSLPFLFLNCVYRRDAIDRYLTLIAFLPLISAVVGIPLDMAGITNFSREEYDTGAFRLRGSSIAAYLAFFAYAGFFACLCQSVTRGRRGFYLLAGVNLIIILLTGTRTMIVTAAVLISAVILFAPQHSFSLSSRLKVALAGTILIAGALLFLWPDLEARFTSGGTSGRDTLWPVYLAAISENPWFGRGIGAGAAVAASIDDWQVQGRAAHNEYLRIATEAGIIGLLIFLAAMVVWVWSERRFMRREEWLLFLTFMFTFALASAVDNTLTGAPTMVVFFTLALIIQRARQREVDTVRPRAITDRMPWRRPVPRPPTLSQPG